MKTISLINSELVALVDDKYWLELALYTWRLDTCGYAAMTTRPHMQMHKIIANKLGLKQADHKDRNKLNNQENNFREATTSQNGANQNKRKSITSSKYKGVTWCIKRKRWRARIRYQRCLKHLSYFVDEKDAALEYNIYAVKYFGEFAALNDIH